MKSKWLFCGLLAVVAAGLAVQTIRLHRALENARQWETRHARLQQELAETRAALSPDEAERLRAETESLRLEVARLRGRLAEALRAGETTPSSPPSSPAAPEAERAGAHNAGRAGWEALLSGRSDAAVQRLVDARLNLAREHLQLSPEQELAIRGAVSNALTSGRENLRRLLAGEATYDDVPTQQEWSRALEKEILALLTPEQQQAYLEQRQQERVANARLAANTELLLIQGALQLDPRQQDAMYAALYDFSLRRMDPEDPGFAARPRDPVAALEWEAAQKRLALEGVLTPAQLANYQKLQQTYRDSAARFLRPLTPGASPPPPPANLPPGP